MTRENRRSYTSSRSQIENGEQKWGLQVINLKMLRLHARPLAQLLIRLPSCIFLLFFFCLAVPQQRGSKRPCTAVFFFNIQRHKPARSYPVR